MTPKEQNKAKSARLCYLAVLLAILETVLTLQGTFSCYFSPDPPPGCM